MKEEINKEETKDDEIKEEAQKKVNKESPQSETDQEEKPLEKMTAKELRSIAREIPGVTGATAMKKDELLAIIKKHRGIEEEEVKKKKKVTSKAGVSVKDLKNKIIMLRAYKEAAYNEKDRKKVDILRRRINRLKKRTRKIV